MSESYDELRVIWSDDDSVHELSAERALRDVERRANVFRHRILFRYWRELVAGTFVFAIFIWFAVRSQDLYVRIANLWVAASGLWIAFRMWRYSTVSRDPRRDKSVAAYREGLLSVYSNQMALLKSAIFWYLLPMWSGLVALALAQWRIGHNTVAWLASIVLQTLLFGFIWWLNKSPGVRYLQRKQAELAVLIHGLEGTME